MTSRIDFYNFLGWSVGNLIVKDIFDSSKNGFFIPEVSMNFFSWSAPYMNPNFIPVLSGFISNLLSPNVTLMSPVSFYSVAW